MSDKSKDSKPRETTGTPVHKTVIGPDGKEKSSQAQSWPSRDEFAQHKPKPQK